MHWGLTRLPLQLWNECLCLCNYLSMPYNECRCGGLTLTQVPGAFLARVNVFPFTRFDRHIPLFQYLMHLSQIVLTLKKIAKKFNVVWEKKPTITPEIQKWRRGVTRAWLARAPLPWSGVPVTMFAESFKWERTILRWQSQSCNLCLVV